MQAITRRIPLRLTPFSVFGLLLAIAGCGTIAIDIRTEIISQQEIRQHLEYVISGPIAELLITDGELDPNAEFNTADLEAVEAEGWEVEIGVEKIDGEDALVMRMSQTFTGPDAAEQFKRASEALAEEDTTTTMVPILDITESEDEIVYDLRMSVSADDQSESNVPDAPFPTVEPLTIDGTPFAGLPDFSGTGSADPAGLDGVFTDGLEDFTDALADSFADFIKLNWTVEMPGDIQDSNATSQDGRTLTWELGLGDFSEEDGPLFARSVVNKNSGGSCGR